MDIMMQTSTMLIAQPSIIKTSNYLFKAKLVIALALALSWSLAASSQPKLPDLTSSSGDESISALLGQDVFISCVAKNLQNYTIVWRFSNDADAPSAQAGNGSQLELGSVLTVGRQRVWPDERFSVINSHDTWLLKISSVRLGDTGTYICQTNSVPPVRVLRILSVLKPAKSAASSDEPADAGTELGAEDARQNFDNIEHNFTDCCRAELVGPRCTSLCDLNQLAFWYRKINIVHECYSSLPSITRCAVAGRNVTECCQRRHVPAKCGSMCGQQLAESMSVQDQSYCADYSASIMSCVAEGVQSLPGQPELVIVEALSPSQLKVSWQKVTDQSELRKLDGWIINLTKLSSFEDTISAPSRWRQQQPSAPDSTSSRVSSSFSISSSASTNSSPLASLNIVDVMNNSSLAAMEKLLAAANASISLKLDKAASEFTIDNLKPYHVYQIQMFAYNSRGRSQISDPIRALTLAPESSAASSDNDDAYVEPKLPDTRKCCLDRGVTLKRCLDTLCDPVEADRANIADLMICAPWSNTTFSCLSSRVNHTECCRARGVSPFCLGMCAGDVKRVDYRHFRCLAHMSVYTNCILESHDVLPSAPQNFTVGPITHAWAVLNWRPPRRHARSLQGYRIYWRRVEPADATKPAPSNASSRALADAQTLDDFFYSSAEAATNPYLLDALEPETVYETFVVAVNKFGQSDSSARFVFQTLSDPERLAADQQLAGGELESRLPLHANATTRPAYYNETACCAQGGVHNSCLQLCDYDMKVSDVSSLITTCNQQMPVIMRCMAGSRNSVPCCRTRGVSDHCLNVCAGLTEHSPLVIATRCAADFGQIIRCMDEGSKQIPSAPVDLHTIEVQPDRVSISWKPAQEDSLRADLEYHVRYQQLQQTSAPGDQAQPEDLSSLIAVVPLHPLEHNLILTTNRTEATVDRLKPNSRYSLYVTAENSYGISLPSLVLVIQTPPGDRQLANADQYQRQASLGAPHSLEVLRSDTESIMLKWLAPLYINSDSQIKYRVFYKLLQPSPSGSSSAESSSQPVPVAGGEPAGAPAQQVASNWTVIETSDTNLVLRNLKYSSQYVITVQAFTRQLLGHMSEILLASTAKPVPPTLNHPLVINQPIEGNNITIMCVALGQPTPQISMFINGLLVQKRTQPYVIYYLVNLARGHLTITCFASNGHGKDYVSVQSRTEISVRFAAKAKVRSSQVRANWQSSARLSCEFSGNPQPTIVWTFAPKLANGTFGPPSVVTPSQRIATLLESQFENPFSWSHTLTLYNLTSKDTGNYQCRARNLLAESIDTVRLEVMEPDFNVLSGSEMIDEMVKNRKSSYERLLEQNSDMMDCCRSQNVSSSCLPACTVDGLDVDLAFKTGECQSELDKLMLCAADGSDHRNCCRSRQVPLSCLKWCSGSRLNLAGLCFLSSAVDINQCFQEGKTLLPGPPSNVRALLASQSSRVHEESESPASTSTLMMGPTMMNMFASSDSMHNSSSVMLLAGDPSSSMESSSAADQQVSPAEPAEPVVIEWDPPKKNADLVQYYRIFWRQYGSRELSRSTTNLTWIKLDGLSKGKLYELVVKAANSHGSSVYSEPLKVRPDELADQTSVLGLPGFVVFGPSSASSLLSRVSSAICFATILMLSIAGLVVALERRGYLSKFASSKSNSSRVSFANPAYTKNADGSGQEDVTWAQSGHSLDVLSSSSSSSGAESGTSSQQASTTSKSEQTGVTNLI